MDEGRGAADCKLAQRPQDHRHGGRAPVRGHPSTVSRRSTAPRAAGSRSRSPEGLLDRQPLTPRAVVELQAPQAPTPPWTSTARDRFSSPTFQLRRLARTAERTSRISASTSPRGLGRRLTLKTARSIRLRRFSIQAATHQISGHH